jgi:hypothetical protein
MKRKPNHKRVLVLLASAVAVIYIASMLTDYLIGLFPLHAHLLKPMIEIPSIILIAVFLLIPLVREYTDKDEDPGRER